MKARLGLLGVTCAVAWLCGCSGEQSSGPGGNGTGTPACPAAMPGHVSTLGGTCTGEGATCDLALDCHSGTEHLSLLCSQGQWTLPTNEACAHAADECNPRFECAGGSWQPPPSTGSEAPAACPWTPPPDHSSCNPGGAYGKDPMECGYPCPAGWGTGWLIASCAAKTGQWGWATCDPGG